MANEAVLFLETEKPVPFLCTDAVAIEKGCPVKIADPYTVSDATAAVDYCGGILAAEKIASDGKKASVYRGGIFKVVASGSITAGATVMLQTLHKFSAATVGATGSKTWGIALETAGDGESFLMELRPGCNTSAFS